ncbi:hypothetical protein QN277_016804 [Acacia crassicarpa]|uniref:Uncharacterized protein n=1 Tax=Acacia crassicarpa TaxID=499986 RepID=A0AAE1MXP1_9FABA|nr:hypothetical protein QN277_016804 [Acacia crassicarpa]
MFGRGSESRADEKSACNQKNSRSTIDITRLGPEHSRSDGRETYIPKMFNMPDEQRRSKPRSTLQASLGRPRLNARFGHNSPPARQRRGEEMRTLGERHR